MLFSEIVDPETPFFDDRWLVSFSLCFLFKKAGKLRIEEEGGFLVGTLAFCK
jgi:hypothetical protein